MTPERSPSTPSVGNPGGDHAPGSERELACTGTCTASWSPSLAGNGRAGAPKALAAGMSVVRRGPFDRLGSQMRATTEKSAPVTRARSRSSYLRRWLRGWVRTRSPRRHPYFYFKPSFSLSACTCEGVSFACAAFLISASVNGL